MASYEFPAIILTGLGLSASILYYSMTIQNQSKTQKLQIIKEIWDWISDEEGYKKFIILMQMTWTDYEDFQHKYGSLTNPEAYAQRFSVWSKMNGLGYMVKEGAIDIESVYDHSAGRIMWMWDKFGSIIIRDREILSAGYLFKWWEYLAGEIRKEADKRAELLNYPKTFSTTPNQ
ncbi:MAG: hypothetical protein ABUK18_05405 [Candidatus Bathyarchaeia archaeon]